MKASITLWTLLLVAQLVCQVPALNTARYSQTPVQYHIQADTGGDRYFRYQTYNGQWRKEKRLRNGKVIGAYGWTDDRGILRLYDYLADEHGYRVVRERTMKVSDGSPQNQLDNAERSDDKAGAFSPSLSSGNRNSNPTFSINDIRRKSYEKARKSFDFSNSNDLGNSVQPTTEDVEELTKPSVIFTKLGEESSAQDNSGYSELVTDKSNDTPSKNLAIESQFYTEETSGNPLENFARDSFRSTNILGGNLVNSEGSIESDASRKDVRTIQRNINEVAKEFNGKNYNFDRASGIVDNNYGNDNITPGNNIARSITNNINTGSEVVNDDTNDFLGNHNKVKANNSPYDEFRSKRKSQITDLDMSERRRITKGRKLRTFVTRQNLPAGENRENDVVTSDISALSNYVSPRDSEQKGSVSTNIDKDVYSENSHFVDRGNINASGNEEIKNNLLVRSVDEQKSLPLSNVQMNSSRPRVSMSKRLRARQDDLKEPMPDTPKVVEARAPRIVSGHRRRNPVVTLPVSHSTLKNSTSSKSLGFNFLETESRPLINSPTESQSLQNLQSSLKTTSGVPSIEPINRSKTWNRGLTGTPNGQDQELTNSFGNSQNKREMHHENSLTLPHETVVNSPRRYTLTQENPLTSIANKLVTNPEQHPPINPSIINKEHTLTIPERHPFTNPEEHKIPSIHKHTLTNSQEHPLINPDEHPLTRPPTPPDALLLLPQNLLTSPQLIRQKRKHSRAQSGVAAPKPTINYDTGTMFHFEELAPDGSKKGRHGYVDPLGFLRVTSYVSGTAGHVETRSSRFVGTRNAGDPT